MIVSRLKDIYAKQVLKEDVKIFKQDPDENSVEHIATLDKVYFNGVFKKILKANDLSSQDVDIELFKKSCKRSNVDPGSTDANDFLFFIKEAGLTFKEENQKAFGDLININAVYSEKASLVQLFNESYKGNVGSHIGELFSIIKKRGQTKGGKAVGSGEIFFEIFAGGDSADVGDMKLNGETYEIKAMPGARLETERSKGEREQLALAAIQNKSLDSIKKIIDNLVGYPENHPGKEELNKGSLDSYIIENKDTIIKALTQRFVNGENVTKAAPFLNLLGFLQLKCYQATKKFDYILTFEEDSTDVKLDFVNKDLSVRQLLEKKNYWKFAYDWSTAAGYSTAMKIKSI